MKKFYCRLCGSDMYDTIFKVKIPIVGRMTKEPTKINFIDEEEETKNALFNLEPVHCKSCGLVQLKNTAEINLYDEYEFTMSYLKEFDDYTNSFINQLSSSLENNQKKVTEIGSNSGYLLNKFQNLGWKVVGIEPSRKLAQQAIENGVDTYIGYFGKNTYEEIIDKYGTFSVVILRHVLEHIDNLHEMISAINKILDEDGILAIEVPYLLQIIRNKAFYAFYHEHIIYFSVETMRNLLETEGFYISYIAENKSEGGGSFLIYAKKGKIEQEISLVNDYIATEKRDITVETLDNLQFAIDEKKTQINSTIQKLHDEGKRIAAWGAGQRGCVLLNLCGLTSKDIEYVVDMNKNYQGKYIPGTDIRVVPPEFHKENPVDLTLIFATGYADSIISENTEYIANGGQFEVV